MDEPLDQLDYMSLLPEGIIGSVGKMEFLARGAVDGFIAGRHRSQHKGFSVEFSEHRQYVPGDDIRNMDWRVYGKSDRYYIKQYIAETNLRATILLDASGSMRYTGERAATVHGRPVSKFDCARYMAAALTYMLIHQQDAVGLVTFDAALRKYIPARSRPSQVRRILETMHETEPGGETAVSDIFHDIAERIHKRGIVFIFSDLFDDADAIIQSLHHFNYRRHEVIVFHIMAEEELLFPFDAFTRFRDLEAPDQLLPVDPKTLKARYMDRIREFLNTIEQGCGQMRADYVPISTRQDFGKQLTGYLSRRRAITGGG